MGAVSGMGTTFNLPNYHGELIKVTPTDTPLLSLAGGIGGGKQTDSVAFEWQTEDLRDPASRPRLEGADAPAAEARSRANVENVCQIFQESVTTSYTKLAATGQYATPSSAPYYTASGEANPVTNEHTHQVMLALQQIARDVNYVFWHGVKVKPTSNATARATDGLLSVVTGTHRKVAGEITGLTSGASNIINETTTGLSNGDKIVFTAPPAELRADRVYYVVNKSTDSFKVATTSGGSAVTIANSQSGIAYVPASASLTTTGLSELMQVVFDDGGISQQGTATLFASSRQKRALTAAFAADYAKADPYAGTRTIAGMSVETIQTDFGVLNVVVERALPPDALAVVSREQVDPVFLNIPGKGVLFEEELAKTGASEKSQIYGEIGLKYGNALAHGVWRGLAV